MGKDTTTILLNNIEASTITFDDLIANIERTIGSKTSKTTIDASSSIAN